MESREKMTPRETLDLVYDALKEKGYDPIYQLIGYLLSEDPSYITNNKKAKQLILRYDRDTDMEELMKNYFGDR